MLEAGDRVGRYRIEATLGVGGMGEVYRAFDPQLARSVALKRLLPGEEKNQAEWVRRMLREARAAAAFNHANAVTIYDVGEADGLPFLVMELVLGKTVREFVQRSEPDWRTRVRWLVDAGRALAAAHAAGLVHRDVKPDNVMVRAGDGAIKVLDFGIARSTRGTVDIDAEGPTQAAPSASPAPLATITQAGVSVGTPAYMSPEQMQGEALDGRSDQFAWGVMLFELLAGTLPWGDADKGVRLVAAILTRPTDALERHRPDLPPALGAVIQQATAKRPEARYATMDVAIVALERALHGNGAHPLPSSRTTDLDVNDARAISGAVAVAHTGKQPAAVLASRRRSKRRLVPPAGTSFRVPLRETIGYADALGPSLFSGAPPPGPHRRSRDGS